MSHDNLDASDRSIAGGESIRRRRFIEATGAGAAVTALAGCIPGDNDGGTPTPGDETPTETQSLEGPIIIGHLAPLDLGIGEGSRRTAEMAVAEINEDGGIMDETVEVIHVDTRREPSHAQSEAERLILEEDVDVIVGTFTSEVTQSIIDLVAEFRIPFIITGSAAPSTITDFIGQNYDRYKNTFRTGPINSNFQAEGFANYADYLSARHGWTDYAFLADDAAWTLPFQQNLPDLLEAKGYNLVYDDVLPQSIDDFAPVMDEVDASGADAVFRFFAHIIAVPMLALWHNLEYQFGIEGIHVASMTPEWLAATQDAALFETTSQSGAGGVAPVTEKTIPFTERYREQWADEGSPSSHPMYMGYETYDGINFYRQAIEAAGTWDYENNLDDIVEAMLETEYEGTSGTISVYGPDAEYPHDARVERDASGVIENALITQWQPSGLECVYPSAVRTEHHMAPPWIE